MAARIDREHQRPHPVRPSRKTSLGEYTDADIDDVIWNLNAIPRKCLGYRTRSRLSPPTSVSHLKCESSSILSHELEIRSRPRAVYLTFEKPKGAPRPQICVIDSAASEDKRLVHALPLHLTHFEYLMRVAHGSLPSSFSKQCFEDFLDFKLRVIDALDQILGSNGGVETEVDFRTLTVESDGRPRIDEFHIGRGW